MTPVCSSRPQWQNVNNLENSRDNPFLQRITSFEERVTYAWDRFVGLFTSDSKDVIYLKAILNKEEELDEKKLGAILVETKSYTQKYYFVKSVLKQCQPDQCKRIIECGFESIFDSSKGSYEKIVAFFDPENISPEFLEEIEILASCFPDTSAENTKKSSLSKTLRVVARFFPNFMDTVLKVFNLIEVGKGPETIWDFAAMLEIYFKIFMIPHTLFLALGVVISDAWKLFLVLSAVIVAAVVGICLYLKYRPCPNSLPRAKNLTEEASFGQLDPVVCREKEVQLIGTYLGKKVGGVKTNLILVGEPGVGKTELVKGVAQKFKEKKIFALNAPELTGGYTSVGDKLRLILLDIKGHEDSVVFFIDELGDAIKKNPQVNLAGLLKPLLNSEGIQVIAAVTSQEYQEQIITDKALQDRFTKIDVNPLSEDEMLYLLESRIAHKGRGVRFAPGVIQKIYQKTEDLAQPRNAVKLLDLAMNTVRTFDIDQYQSEELLEAEKTLSHKQLEFQSAVNQGLEDKGSLVREIMELKSRIEALASETKKKVTLANKIRNLISMQQTLKNNRDRMAKEGSNNIRLPFLHTLLLPWLESKISDSITQIKEIPLQVDDLLIQQISKDWKGKVKDKVPLQESKY